jgi:hypothetical protein
MFILRNLKFESNLKSSDKRFITIILRKERRLKFIFDSIGSYTLTKENKTKIKTWNISVFENWNIK